MEISKKIFLNIFFLRKKGIIIKVKVSDGWMAYKGRSLRTNIGYCDMVPYRTVFSKKNDLYSVLIDGMSWPMLLKDFEIIGEDDIKKIKRANDISMANHVSKKIKLTETLNSCLLCKIYIREDVIAFDIVGHFEDDGLNLFLDTIGLSSNDREWFSYMYGEFVFEYCKENKIPFLEINIAGDGIVLENHNLTRIEHGTYDVPDIDVLNKLILSMIENERYAY